MPSVPPVNDSQCKSPTTREQMHRSIERIEEWKYVAQALLIACETVLVMERAKLEALK